MASPEFQKFFIAHDQPRLYQKIAWALGEIGDPRALETLCHLMSERNMATRVAAAVALHQLGETDATTFLVETYGTEISGDNRRKILKALLSSQTLEAIPLLEQALNDPLEILRILAIEGLATMQGTDALPIIREKQHDASSTVRETAQQIITQLGG